MPSIDSFAAKPIAIYHEHPDWFRPLFAELDRRGIPYVRLDAAAHTFDPSERAAPYSLVVNRASPSAYLRGHAQSTFYTLHWLRHLERLGIPVVNGSRVLRLRAVKGVAARPARGARPAVPAVARDQQSSAGCSRCRGPALSGAREGEHRR